MDDFTSALGLSRSSLSQQIADKLEELILSGRLSPGDRLPPERDLARQLGVSRPTLREAIHLLQDRGFLEQRQGDGTYLTGMHSDQLYRSVQRLFVSANRPYEELVSIREMFEPVVAGVAARHAKPENTEAVQQAIWASQKPGITAEEYAQAVMNIHRAIIEATQNKMLVALFRPVLDLMLKTTGLMFVRLHRSTDNLTGPDEHQQILDCIKDGRAEDAAAAMRHHLRHLRRDVAEFLSRSEGASGDDAVG